MLTQTKLGALTFILFYQVQIEISPPFQKYLLMKYISFFLGCEKNNKLYPCKYLTLFRISDACTCLNCIPITERRW